MHKATLYDSGNEVAGKGTGKFVRSKITHFLLDLKEQSDLFSLQLMAKTAITEKRSNFFIF